MEKSKKLTNKGRKEGRKEAKKETKKKGMEDRRGKKRRDKTVVEKGRRHRGM